MVGIGLSEVLLLFSLAPVALLVAGVVLVVHLARRAVPPPGPTLTYRVKVPVLFEPVLWSEDGRSVAERPGAFTDEAEAERVLQTWREQGHTQPMAVNRLPVFEAADQWRAARPPA